MRLLNRDLFRSFAIGFALGGALIVAAMSAESGGLTGLVGQAIAAPAQPPAGQ
ncbi:hypothetical protein [Novosphingobium sp. KACC 22771]|uniref:hypothetical protein n=1 Tax=Novosphingobium sp. KACC 22771 TaxID=3025670 RepID=UPI002365700F|nr:hypothetical protein [Novosphingobium sp. KACC 22771]WDF72631.1 hypothetical protein PQ467_00895 [Novosphingobium sp. KACC 22771]